MDLAPIDSIDDILQIIEYQLTLFLLVTWGVFTATLILVSYVIFWSMKLTGKYKIRQRPPPLKVGYSVFTEI